MALVPRDPFADIDRFFGDIFPRFSPEVGLGMTAPAMDVYETETEVIAEVSLPGIDPDNVDVNVDEQALIVSGTSEQKREETEKGYVRKEIQRGAFRRAVHLPSPVVPDSADATYEDGVLKITMQKSASESAGKRVEIKKK